MERRRKLSNINLRSWDLIKGFNWKNVHEANEDKNPHRKVSRVASTTKKHQRTAMECERREKSELERALIKKSFTDLAVLEGK